MRSNNSNYKLSLTFACFLSDSQWHISHSDQCCDRGRRRLPLCVPACGGRTSSEGTSGTDFCKGRIFINH
jgi:hypothetical protein